VSRHDELGEFTDLAAASAVRELVLRALAACAAVGSVLVSARGFTTRMFPSQPGPAAVPGAAPIDAQVAENPRRTSYGLPSDITWRNAYGSWQLGTRPGCMAPLSSGQRIRFGLVNAAPVADAPGSPVLVWIECPSLPIPRYPIVTPPTTSG
jgi:hypothetical protein